MFCFSQDLTPHVNIGGNAISDQGKENLRTDYVCTASTPSATSLVHHKVVHKVARVELGDQCLGHNHLRRIQLSLNHDAGSLASRSSPCRSAEDSSGSSQRARLIAKGYQTRSASNESASSSDQRAARETSEASAVFFNEERPSADDLQSESKRPTKVTDADLESESSEDGVKLFSSSAPDACSHMEEPPDLSRRERTGTPRQHRDRVSRTSAVSNNNTKIHPRGSPRNKCQKIRVTRKLSFQNALSAIMESDESQGSMVDVDDDSPNASEGDGELQSSSPLPDPSEFLSRPSRLPQPSKRPQSAGLLRNRSKSSDVYTRLKVRFGLQEEAAASVTRSDPGKGRDVDVESSDSLDFPLVIDESRKASEAEEEALTPHLTQPAKFPSQSSKIHGGGSKHSNVRARLSSPLPDPSEFLSRPSRLPQPSKRPQSAGLLRNRSKSSDVYTRLKVRFGLQEEAAASVTRSDPGKGRDVDVESSDSLDFPLVIDESRKASEAEEEALTPHLTQPAKFPSQSSKIHGGGSEGSKVRAWLKNSYGHRKEMLNRVEDSASDSGFHGVRYPPAGQGKGSASSTRRWAGSQDLQHTGFASSSFFRKKPVQVTPKKKTKRILFIESDSDISQDSMPSPQRKGKLRKGNVGRSALGENIGRQTRPACDEPDSDDMPLNRPRQAGTKRRESDAGETRHGGSDIAEVSEQYGYAGWKSDHQLPQKKQKRRQSNSPPKNAGNMEARINLSPFPFSPPASPVVKKGARRNQEVWAAKQKLTKGKTARSTCATNITPHERSVYSLSASTEEDEALANRNEKSFLERRIGMMGKKGTSNIFSTEQYGNAGRKSDHQLPEKKQYKRRQSNSPPKNAGNMEARINLSPFPFSPPASPVVKKGARQSQEVWAAKQKLTKGKTAQSACATDIAPHERSGYSLSESTEEDGALANRIEKSFLERRNGMKGKKGTANIFSTEFVPRDEKLVFSVSSESTGDEACSVARNSTRSEVWSQGKLGCGEPWRAVSYNGEMLKFPVIKLEDVQQTNTALALPAGSGEEATTSGCKRARNVFDVFEPGAHRERTKNAGSAGEGDHVDTPSQTPRSSVRAPTQTEAQNGSILSSAGRDQLFETRQPASLDESRSMLRKQRTVRKIAPKLCTTLKLRKQASPNKLSSSSELEEWTVVTQDDSELSADDRRCEDAPCKAEMLQRRRSLCGKVCSLCCGSVAVARSSVCCFLGLV